ncbi:MAG: DUF4241 domain-containing protein [Actinobacteria bacterium]|nr:DUF4241 domain-containing protein [Actinomycetota bacterium]
MNKKNEKLKIDEWVKIGVIGVDSAHVLVCDPCYIDSEWTKEDGDIEKLLKVKDTEEIIDMEAVLQKGRTYKSEWKEGITYNEGIERGLLKSVPVKQTHTFSLDGCFRETCKKSEGGQLNYKKGHAGVGVVCSSGFGDGTYNVFVKYDNFDNWGQRIVELKVVFVSEKEREAFKNMDRDRNNR